ncbi:siderophore-interacting protein [Aureimonas leprariae]|uniref:Siderophore-interacting protein n=1 Tax=Plantimonas leprariae TaxID=2615207 RepID=A0A7V7PLG1_9HYPH|nr:siderophore-interacting protein [Aureimonas leprariae]KAB0677218.1 siderophore-interacting protein [Aureimonas leprariae]
MSRSNLGVTRLASTLVLDAVADPADLLGHFAPYGTSSGRGARRELALRLYGAEATIRREGDRVVILAEAEDAGSLATMKYMIAYTVCHALGADESVVRWSGEGAGTSDLPQFRELRVVDSWNVTPGMRRVRLGGRDLARFARGGLHIRLLIPPAGRAPVWPHAGPAAIPVWPEGEARLTVRVYTIRRIVPEEGLLDIDVVLHEGASPGGDWARNARAGDVVGIMGPGGDDTLPADRLLLAGDETALPAIARILEELPEEATGAALIEIPCEEDRQEIRRPPGVELVWLPRGGRAAGTTGLLSQALLARANDGGDADMFRWSGSEFGDFQRLRHHCRKVLKLPRDRHSVTAYWRRGVDPHDEG